MKFLFPVLLRIYIVFHEDIVTKSSLLQLFKSSSDFFQSKLAYFKYNNKIISVSFRGGSEIEMYLLSISDNQNRHVKVYVYLNTDLFVYNPKQ